MITGKKTIRLCYRKIIDANVQTPWDQYVWEDTYQELLMQSQMYNTDKKHKLYSGLLKEVKNADKLPYLVSTVVVGYLKQLHGIMPDITNVLNKLCLPFKSYKFDIMESDFTNRAAHQIAVDFIIEPLTWHDTINGMLLISVNETCDTNDGTLLTEMVPVQPFLSIFSIKHETL